MRCAAAERLPRISFAKIDSAGLAKRLRSVMRSSGSTSQVQIWTLPGVGVRPWQMTAKAYLAAPGGGALTGRPAATPWEPELAEVMAERGVSVHEEQVVDLLLTDWPAEAQ